MNTELAIVITIKVAALLILIAAGVFTWSESKTKKETWWDLFGIFWMAAIMCTIIVTVLGGIGFLISQLLYFLFFYWP